MAVNQILKPEHIGQLLRYDAGSGILFWKRRSLEMFSHATYNPVRAAAAWNGRYADKEAFTSVGNHGYREGAINGRTYLAHRVIWALYCGFWPEAGIDHIDGDRLNNRISNLREADQASNCKNQAGKCTNSSGETGISWRPDRNKWRARIVVGYREIALGSFDTYDAAVAARRAALIEYGFSPRHGALGQQPGVAAE